ncbi:hypothetical protein CLV30_11943 [Haloactinopolyspora alba]|uniref:Uncharacterized protein n=1 Tax=Haloactinopolyspora alba TaxID=648780 RepID=A0A2P8DN86_9ACTN|nr:hypothetical protein [Haloactinopolyspora alba]PSK98660.1 hypothetical protein CLV30_11943 [Haloactinopolyspora alba]
MTTPDPMHEALDRLARVADTRPVDDPMPGITRRARANRRRATAVVAGGLAAVVIAGAGALSVLDLPGRAGEPGYANSPSASSSPDPSPSPSPDPSTPTSPPREPALAEYDQARGDVDGDGAADTIRVMIPEADAEQGQDVGILSTDVWLQVEPTAGAPVEVAFGETLAPSIAGTPDLDGNGTADVVLIFSGGDAGSLQVFTWDGDTVVQAEPGPGSPADLVDDGGLYMDTYIGSFALVDGGLISWVSTGDASEPDEVRAWTWQLEENRLVATETDQAHCMRAARYPVPC